MITATLLRFYAASVFRGACFRDEGLIADIELEELTLETIKQLRE